MPVPSVMAPVPTLHPTLAVPTEAVARPPVGDCVMVMDAPGVAASTHEPARSQVAGRSFCAKSVRLRGVDTNPTPVTGRNTVSP